MKHILLSILSLAFFHVSYSQFTASPNSIVDDLNSIDYSIEHKLGKKAAGNNVSCDGDTIDYARYKATSLVGINISNGYRLGQYYETPGDVSISGFDFYAWQNMGTSGVVEVLCQLFAAGADSLPSGAPVREDTLYIDSTFGGGVLTVLQKRAVFSSPYTTNTPYIVVLTTSDTNRVAVVTNSYSAGDGDGEDLGCGTVGGRWYKFSGLNIGGTTLDCDVLLEPHVGYTIYNDFTVKDCYDYRDTVRFTNKTSPFLSSKVYNRYKYFNIEQYCHRWDFYGSGSTQYMVEGKIKYSAGRNYKVRLISTLYHYRGGGTCIDTTYRNLNFQPDEITFSGDKNVCSGDNATVIANTNSNVEWYRNPNDTTSFNSGSLYAASAPLQENDTVYAKAINNSCVSLLKRNVTYVAKSPNVPTVTHDSVCLNSLANLTATSNVGVIRWYADSTTLVPVYIGDVFQVGPLNRDTFFYAQAHNGVCTHEGRVKATAYVSSDFAPAAPTVSNDTVICLLSNPITLHASSSNTLRWYNVGAGGNIIETGDTLNFTPTARGEFRRFVDAYDGSCASSRLPILITVNHFPTLSGLTDLSGCAGDTLTMDLSMLDGNITWYDMETGGNTVYSGKSRVFETINSDETFYLEPYEGLCRDSLRHAFSIESIPYGKIVSQQLDSMACDNTIPTLSIQTDLGEIQWLNDELDSVIYVGTDYTVDPVRFNVDVHYRIDNKGCVSKPVTHKVKWLLVPGANFDYQVVWRNVEFASRLIGQGDYVWHFGDGSDTLMGTDVKHYYAEDGEYDASLMVTTPFGCADTIYKTIAISTLGVDKMSVDRLSIYPNPISGDGTLSLFSEETWTTYSILDALGRTVQSGLITFKDNYAAIGLSAIAPGQYFVELKNDQQRTLKVMVVR